MIKVYRTLLFFLAICFFGSCSSSSEGLSKDEKTWMTKFFRDIMLEENCIYTLWGSKPMTRIIIYKYPEEMVKEYLESLSKEDMKNARIISKYDLPENWERWEEIKDRFPLKRYMLFEVKWQNEPHVKILYFVDILKTALVLQEHYLEFREYVGFDFDPMEVVLEMKDPSPLFWEKIQTNSLLWGLLFGYGKENAYAFHWKYSAHSDRVEDFFGRLKGDFSCESLNGSAKRRLSNLEIPSFISFQTSDPMVKKYSDEKSEIQGIYRGKDFLDTTLDQLVKD